jgi:hypothetical protein
MLRLLLDEHVSPRLADELPRHRSRLELIALQDFENGAYLGAPDAEMLQAADAHQLTLVTYDVRTIPSLLRTWAETGVRHNGVIFVNRKSIDPADIGALVRALCDLFDALGDVDWTDRVVFLPLS